VILNKILVFFILIFLSQSYGKPKISYDDYKNGKLGIKISEIFHKFPKNTWNFIAIIFKQPHILANFQNKFCKKFLNYYAGFVQDCGAGYVILTHHAFKYIDYQILHYRSYSLTLPKNRIISQSSALIITDLSINLKDLKITMKLKS
ncbi:hypothetical protein MXB_4704, partial [Myxobolus squamalis]